MTGPTRQNYERKLNDEFDQYVKKIKDSKKEYLNNKEKFNTFIKSKKSLAKEMESINEQNCNIKHPDKKLGRLIIKTKFIDIGPVDHQENDELWINFKINKKFLQEKNSFFKNLKKLDLNIKNQIELIDVTQDKEKLIKHAVYKN